MAVYQKYLAAVEPLVEADNAGTAVWKIALSTTFTNTDTAFVAGTTDLATANGYTAGGNTCTTVTAQQTAGTFKLVLANPATWVASSTGFTSRYAILYNSTTNVPYAAWDYGSSVVMNGANADTFSVNLDAGTGVFQVA